MPETHPHPVLTSGLSDRLTMNWLQILYLLVNIWVSSKHLDQFSPHFHSVEQVDLLSDESDFLSICECASTPDHLSQCSQPPKKGLRHKNNIHTDAQRSKVGCQDLSTEDYTDQYILKSLKRKNSKCQRLAFDKADMDWLKGELHDIKFEIGKVRSSMLGIAEHLWMISWSIFYI